MTTRRSLGSSLGVMQGRLSPMTFGAYQAFPRGVWEQEFQLARQRGLQHVEWVVDTPDLDSNPLMAEVARVKSVQQSTNVNVVSVCGDFLMDTPLRDNDAHVWRRMEVLVRNMSELGAGQLVIPCVDHASLRSLQARGQLVAALGRLTDEYPDAGITFALETDLPPADLSALLDDANPELIGVNYDIGNSASLGFDPDEELEEYGARVTLLHVKDRLRGRGSVMLGDGDADIPLVCAKLWNCGFKGPVTLQAFRDFDGVEVFDQQLTYFREILANL